MNNTTQTAELCIVEYAKCGSTIQIQVFGVILKGHLQTKPVTVWAQNAMYHGVNHASTQCCDRLMELWPDCETADRLCTSNGPRPLQVFSDGLVCYLGTWKRYTVDKIDDQVTHIWMYNPAICHPHCPCVDLAWLTDFKIPTVQVRHGEAGLA